MSRTRINRGFFNFQQCLNAPNLRLTEAGEVEGSDSLLAVGGVHHDCRIDGRGNLFHVVKQYDGRTGHGTAVVAGTESRTPLHVQWFNNRIPIKQAVGEILPEFRRAKCKPLCRARTLLNVLLNKRSVGASEFDGYGDPHSIFVLAIVLSRSLGAVVEGTLGEFHHFRVRGEQFGRRDPGAGFGDWEMPTIFFQELSRSFIAALAEKVCFADGLVRKRSAESKRAGSEE